MARISYICLRTVLETLGSVLGSLVDLSSGIFALVSPDKTLVQ